jgi:hypothetical protein
MCAKHPRQSAVIELNLTMINSTQTRTHLRGRVPFGRNDYGRVNNEKVSRADLTDVKATAWPPLTSVVFLTSYTR